MYIEKRNRKFFYNIIKRTLHSFTFFFCEICNFCMTYETKKKVPFFYKERKRTQRSEHSFIKNGKERKDRSVLL